jgi:hypothetical protein
LENKTPNPSSFYAYLICLLHLSRYNSVLLKIKKSVCSLYSLWLFCCPRGSILILDVVPKEMKDIQKEPHLLVTNSQKAITVMGVTDYKKWIKISKGKDAQGRAGKVLFFSSFRVRVCYPSSVNL